MENAKKFFEEMIKTEEAKALFESAGTPETEEDRIAAYIDIAKKLGVELEADEIRAYLMVAGSACASEIDDEELSQLAGGGENAECSSTYKHKENCWWNDGCDIIVNSYDNYRMNMAKKQMYNKAYSCSSSALQQTKQQVTVMK